MKKGATALIVDDEADIRELVEITLLRMGVRTQAADCVELAKTMLGERSYDFCLTDMKLPDGNGIDLVRHIQTSASAMPVAVITAHGNAQAAVESLKAGAFDFVQKPLNLTVLRKLVDSALKLREQAEASDVTERLQGNEPSIIQLRALIERLSRSQAPVHIHGESGTGKELVARLIHEKGPRAAAPFVPVNCGAIPDELMESEFFGHLKGSFTGALRDKQGLFQAAEGGTLFLDEVGDLPLHMQVKLLRALQERAVRPVGAETEVPVNVRIISATNLKLADQVAAGEFRQDLFYRLNVIEVRTPPLRERRGDIPPLANQLLTRLARDAGINPEPVLDESALRALVAYDFPGNVRELENILERAITLCEGNRISAWDLQLRVQSADSTIAGQAVGSVSRGGMVTAAAPTASPPPLAASGASLDEHIEEIERRAIREALEKARYNKTKAAELLGMTFRQLRYKVKKLGIE